LSLISLVYSTVFIPVYFWVAGAAALVLEISHGQQKSLIVGLPYRPYF